MRTEHFLKLRFLCFIYIIGYCVNVSARDIYAVFTELMLCKMSMYCKCNVYSMYFKTTCLSFGCFFAHSYLPCYVGPHSDQRALATEKQTYQECVTADNVLLYWLTADNITVK